VEAREIGGSGNDGMDVTAQRDSRSDAMPADAA